MPIFDTSTSEEKLIEQGVVAEPIETDSADLESLLEPLNAEDVSGEDGDSEEQSYMQTVFEGSNLLMNVLLICIVLVLFVCFIGLLLLCRNLIKTRCCSCV